MPLGLGRLLKNLGGKASEQNGELHPGNTVGSGRFTVTKRLGAGQFATVYMVEARDGTRFALKKEKFGEMPEADRQEALNELRLLASLHSPNLVQYNEAFIEGNSLGIVMDLMLGGSLMDVIRAHAESGQRIPEGQVWSYLLQAARGLHHLHSRSILHRDIKPANLLLQPGGLLKVADLGVAGVLRRDACERQQAGTAGFMAPEVARRQCQDVNADIFSLGVCLYELCTLRSPFGGKGEQQVLQTLVGWNWGDAAMAAAALYPQYSEELRALLQAMLQPDPSARPSAKQILTRHGTPERLARLPAPPAQDMCGRPWDESQDSPILPPIELPTDLSQLNERLPPPCCCRMGCRSAANAT